MKSARSLPSSRPTTVNEPTDDTTENTEAEAPAAPAPPPRELTDDEVKRLLEWILANPNDPEAGGTFAELAPLLRRPGMGARAVEVAQALSKPCLEAEDPTPAQHALMTIVLHTLLQLSGSAAVIDGLFTLWLRHPHSFGPAHATPPEYQGEHFLQRVGDLLGWGTLDVTKDEAALLRFAEWVETWSRRNKNRSRRAIEALRRNFPAPRVWKVIRL